MAGRHSTVTGRAGGPTPRGRSPHSPMDGMRSEAAARAIGPRSIPQPLQVPSVLATVEVEVDDHSPTSLDPPVLAVPALVPPPAHDQPPSEHAANLAPPPAPRDGARHP